MIFIAIVVFIMFVLLKTQTLTTQMREKFNIHTNKYPKIWDFQHNTKIIYFSNLLNQFETNSMQEFAKSRFERNHNHNDTVYLLPNDPFISSIVKKIEKTTKKKIKTFQIIRNTVGKPMRKFLDTPNLVIAYLNDDYTGGVTIFPFLGKSIKAYKNHGIYITNRTLHFQNSIRSGEQYLLYVILQ